MFSLEIWKINVHSENATNLKQIGFGFLVNFISIGSGKFSLIGRIWSAVNVLTNNPEISDLTEETFFGSE